MLVENASEYIDSTTELSINTKVYTAKALNRELVTPEFLQASTPLQASKKVEVIAETTALESAGAQTDQAAKYATAKASRLAAQAAWNAAQSSGDKKAAKAAEAAFMAAKVVEQEAGLAAAAAVGTASSASVAAAAAAKAATAEVAEVAKTAAEAAQQATTEVAEVAKSAAQDAQQAALDALWTLEGLPGSSGTHTIEVTAAIRQVQAEMHGNDFNYMGHSSYESLMEAIKSGEVNVDTHMNWDYEKNPEGHDPNRMGPCGKPSC